MPRSGRFSRQWRESKIETLERDLAELHKEKHWPGDRHAVIPFQVSRFTEWLRMHPAVILHLGRSREEFIAEPGWDPYISPADAERADGLWLRCALSGRPYLGLEYRWRHSESGRYVYLSETLFPATWGPDGKPMRMEGWFENITPRKRAELEFLLCCLDASGSKRCGEARRSVARRVLEESLPKTEILPLLRRSPSGKPRPRR